MIVKDEEAIIKDCLESVKYADEIIVLDTGSTDKTCEIAKKYTDKVHERAYQWNDSFSEARNKAKEYCTTDWILSIDADEVLEDGGMVKIKEAIKGAKNAVSVVMTDGKTIRYDFPRVFKNDPNVFWEGAIHNYLNVLPDCKSMATITFGYSPAHKADPNRALRILLKEVKRGVGPREIFYLAREYMYRKQWGNAIYYYDLYLSKAVWAPEMAEAAFQRAQAYNALGNLKKAQESALEAIRINADFKEALHFLATITGPKNSKRWMEFARTANNNDVLFIRNLEKKEDYYNRLFLASPDMSRYSQIYSQVALWATGTVLDLGCGTAEMQKYVKDYHGIDFSKEAVKIANNSSVKVGNILEEPLGDYDTYLLLEVLEHINEDKGLLERIPSGKQVILSVPSFADPSHVRIYDRLMVTERYKDLLDIQQVIPYYWSDTGKWSCESKQTESCIYLVKAIRKGAIYKDRSLNNNHTNKKKR